MEFLNILLTLLPFLVFLYMLRKTLTISKHARSYSHIPGPKPLPLIGNLHLMAGATTPHHFFRDLSAKHGPLMHLQLGEVHFLVISSTDHAKEVVKTHDVNFANRPPAMVAEGLTYDYSDVGFAPYGEYWRQLRKICTLELLSARRVQSFRPIREEENMNMAKWIASQQGTAADISEKLYLSSYDVITRATVGAKTKERGEVISIIKEATGLASGFIMADLYPSMKFLPLITGVGAQIKRMRRNLDRVLGNIVDEHRAANAVKSDDDETLEDLADVLLKIQEDGAKLSLTTDNIKAVLLNMFVAGTETAATTVEWALSEMLRSPDKLKKAQDEVRRVFDDKGYVDEDKFNDLKYMKNVIKETLRLHAPVPLLVPRENMQACEINGYKIPARTRVIINAWAMGRDPKYWNKAEEFIPERFEESSVDFKGNNFEFIPFGAGRRICAGITFGMANVEFTLATLLYHFDWKLPNSTDELDMTEGFGSTIKRKNPLNLIPIVKRPLHAPA